MIVLCVVLAVVVWLAVEMAIDALYGSGAVLDLHQLDDAEIDRLLE